MHHLRADKLIGALFIHGLENQLVELVVQFQHRVVDAGILYVAALGFQIFVKQCKDIRRNALLAEQAQGRQLQGQADELGFLDEVVVDLADEASLLRIDLHQIQAGHLDESLPHRRPGEV